MSRSDDLKEGIERLKKLYAGDPESVAAFIADVRANPDFTPEEKERYVRLTLKQAERAQCGPEFLLRDLPPMFQSIPKKDTK